MKCIRCESERSRKDGQTRLAGQRWRCNACHRRFTARSTSAFSHHGFPDDVIALAVRWYIRYRLSYADVVEWFAERGLIVDRSTLYRWVQRFLPLFGEAARSYRRAVGKKWRVDETYTRLQGRWTYIYRAIDQDGQVVDAALSVPNACYTLDIIWVKKVVLGASTMAESIPILIDLADIQAHVSVDPWTELAETLLRNLRSPHSRRAYATSLRDFFAVCQRPPDQVTKQDIIAYRDELREQAYSAATINRHLAAIRVLYQAALDEGLIDRNPAAGVKTLETSAEGTTSALSGDEVRALLNSIDRTTLPGLRDYALILLLVGTGLRREEAARLQIADLGQHLGHWTLRITRKGGKGQYVKVRGDVYRAVQAWLAAASLNEGPLWRSVKREGRKPNMRYVLAGPLTADGILKILQQRAKQAGITTHMTPHVLRATFITLALDAGAPLHKVQYAAGHADPRTTERYHRSKQNLDDNAVDYLKL